MKKKIKSEAAILELLGDNLIKLKTIDDELEINNESIDKSTALRNVNKPNTLNIIDKINENNESFSIVATRKCEPWYYSDRNEFEMGDIDLLSKSIKKYGQQEPILLRPKLKIIDQVEYEIIFGNRRWRACKKANIPVKAIIKKMSNQNAIAYQKEENDNRIGISDYSKAIVYKKLLKDKVFDSEKSLSEKINMSKQSLNLIMSYTRIDKRIIKKFKNPHKISKNLAGKLASISTNVLNGKCSPKYLNKIIGLIPYIEEKKISYRKFEKIISNKNNIITDELNDNEKLFCIRNITDSKIEITFEREFLRNCSMNTIVIFLKRYISRINK